MPNCGNKPFASLASKADAHSVDEFGQCLTRCSGRMALWSLVPCGSGDGDLTEHVRRRQCQPGAFTANSDRIGLHSPCRSSTFSAGVGSDATTHAMHEATTQVISIWRDLPEPNRPLHSPS